MLFFSEELEQVIGPETQFQPFQHSPPGGGASHGGPLEEQLGWSSLQD